MGVVVVWTVNAVASIYFLFRYRATREIMLDFCINWEKEKRCVCVHITMATASSLY